MASFDELSDKQKVIADVIVKIGKDYKKESYAKRTKTFVENKLKLLDSSWKEYQANSIELEVFREDYSDHPYFTESHFHQVESAVNDIKEILNSRLKEIQSKEQVNTLENPKSATSKSSASQERSLDQEQRFRMLIAKKSSLLRITENIQQEMGNSHSLVYLQQKIKLLNDYWHNLSSIHDSIIANASIFDQEDDYLKHNRFAELEDIYHDVIILLEEKVHELNKDMVVSNTISATQQSISFDVKLPRLSIPTFNGNYLYWKSFHDLFLQLVHNNKNLSNVQKMQYLKTNLSGEASKLLRHLHITETNYKTAWDTLINRYDNKRILLSHHLQTLLAQPTLAFESADGVRKLHDTTNECLHAIENLGIETSSWGPIIVHIITNKLDKETHKLYEQSLSNPREVTPLKDFLQYLELRFQSLDTLRSPKQRTEISVSKYSKNTFQNAAQKSKLHSANQSTKTFHTSFKELCPLCKKTHKLFTCSKFKSMNATQRYDIVKKENLCTNCLHSHHSGQPCPSNSTCRVCQQKHNTLLHINNTLNSKTTNAPASLPSSSISSITAQYPEHLAAYSNSTKNSVRDDIVLLATALIKVINKGKEYTCRALIDQGSQKSFVTESTVQKLGLKKCKMYATVTGIGLTNAGTIRSSVQLQIRSLHNSRFEMFVNALVLSKLTNLIPQDYVQENQWSHLKNLKLADPYFNQSSPVDIILGADVFGDFLLSGVIKASQGMPIAQETELGWIISGNAKRSSTNNTKVMCHVSQFEMDNQIKRFWDIEDSDNKSKQTSEDDECERFFQLTHTRNLEGRYVVRIPFDQSKANVKLGESKKQAVAILLQMEKKFRNNKDLEREYKQFMHEYIQLGHMVKTKPINTNQVSSSYYMPHHAVFKDDSTTTKVRVVFNGSAPTSTGTSLNDITLNGPKLQYDLDIVLIRWRRHQIVYTADIEKMYRQILVADEDQDFQRIVWRDCLNEPISDFKLTTATHGTKSAGFLSIRSLIQLAYDHKGKFPKAAEIILKDFYVDNLLSGSNTLQNALCEQKELILLLQSGGFNLRKWASNHQNMLNDIPEQSREIGVQDPADCTIKALGLYWQANTDCFTFKTSQFIFSNVITKRKFLSESSKIFDPLGWLAPSVVMIKILFQELWSRGTDWDEKLPDDLEEKWTCFKKELSCFESLKIPRYMSCLDTSATVELHGFCDASKRAYAAVVYSRVINCNGEVKVTLIAAKTKVAPIKPISLPRLELCGALLLVKLLNRTTEALDINANSTYGWTDSMIVLSWLAARPGKWKTFVANRISEIQSMKAPRIWNHVRSEENPADVASRGIQPSRLTDFTLWWNGPSWLKQKEIIFNNSLQTLDEKSVEAREETRTILVTTTTTQGDISRMISNFSSLSRLLRVVAYCQRFILNIGRYKNQRITGPLKYQDINAALKALIKGVQASEFKKELCELNKKREVRGDSKIKSLHPFIDGEGILRVGGRLQQSNLGYYSKHPAIIPQKCPLTPLIVRWAHKQTLHGGTDLTSAYIRQQFWIIRERNVVRQELHKCVSCFKLKAKCAEQLMGELPRPRITSSKPFTHVGVDYAGPIQIKAYKGRGHKTYKGYIAIFVCLATKAIHIESVSDLTAQGFISAFKRFAARRGNVSHIYSDNATNFVLANKILKASEVHQIKSYSNEIFDALTNMQINWHFIPPGSPHFGGLWEAGVKSVKRHLKSTVCESVLTFEEISTLLAQIEACLNSRPLCQLSNDPNDLEALTPGHFLIGGPIVSVPEDSMLESNINLLNRWQLIQRAHQEFWKRWSKEYLTRLQQRPKWLSPRKNLKSGDIVILKDVQLPPSKWALGRITNVHYGRDGKVRVADVRCKNGTYTRTITKLCRLPLSEDHEPENSTDISQQRSDDVTVCHAAKQFRKKSLPKYQPLYKPIGQILCVALFATLISGGFQQDINKPFTIQHFSSNPGIYFENVGDVRLVNNEWKIIVYYDLTNYWREFIGFRKWLEKLTYICTNISHVERARNQCDVYLKQFQHRFKVIEQKNNILQNRNGVINIEYRKKRAPFEFVGTIANKLFGILDDESASQYEEQIQKVQLNENYLLELIKNQTSIAETTANIMKESQDEIYKQFQDFEKQLNDIKASIVSDRSNQNFVIDLLSAIEHASLSFGNFENTQNALLDMAMDTHHGKINPLIINPKQLRDQLDIIRMHAPSTLSVFEAGSDMNLLQVYKALAIKTKIIKNKMLFEVNCPLLNNEYFEVFKLISLPTPHHNQSVFIQPSSDYLVISIRRDRFYPLNENEFRLCTTLRESQYLCRQRHPIYNIMANVSRCELSLLNHQRPLPDSCNLRISNQKLNWIQLHNPNAWIFILEREHTFDIICDRLVMAQTLIGIGTINLNSNCVIKEMSMIINSHNIYSSRVNSSFIPAFNLTNVLKNNINTFGTDYSNVLLRNNVNYSVQDFKNLDNLLFSQRNNENHLQVLNAHDIHHYAISYVIISFILAIVIWMFYKRGTCSKTKLKVNETELHELHEIKPTPKPRRYDPQEYRLPQI